MSSSAPPRSVGGSSRCVPPTTPPPYVFVAAGEVSGDGIAAAVVAELRRRRPDLRFYGAGGAAMEQVGVEIRHHIDGLAVAGLTEIAGVFGAVSRLWADTWWETLRRPPRLAILVDYPGANMRLASMLKRRGVPVLFYVAPQAWAWRPGRAAQIARCVDYLAVTLPFEEDWFRRRGVRVEYVGHPLCERRSGAASGHEVVDRLGLDRRPILALLPGSRAGEVRRHLPLLRLAVRWLPEVQPVLAVLPGGHERQCARLAVELPRLSAEEAFSVADVALCCSGSATLEAALARVPTAVFYRLSAVSAAIARGVLTTEHLALPNILLDAPIMPELLQDDMTPQSLALVVRRLLEPSEAIRQRAAMGGLAKMLKEKGPASVRVGDLAERLLDL